MNWPGLGARLSEILHTGKTDSLNVCGELHCVKKKLFRNLALCRDNPEQNTDTIHASHLEHLHVFAMAFACKAKPWP